MKPFVPPGYRAPTGHCRYGDSRLPFRGPKRRLDGDYLLCLGGNETYGKFIETPYPALLEEVIGIPCVNMGCINAGVDAYLKDRAVIEFAQRAQAVVLQVLGAHNLSNRFYTVHPRRNDRFLRASSVLQGLYPELDFADYNFTRHLLSELSDLDPERFDIVVGELRTAWAARMRSLIQDIDVPVVLFWFSDHLPDDADHHDPRRDDPLFVTAGMLDGLRDLASAVIVLRPSEPAIRNPTDGMRFDPSEAEVAAQMLGAAAHRQALAVLTGPVRRSLSARSRGEKGKAVALPMRSLSRESG